MKKRVSVFIMITLAFALVTGCTQSNSEDIQVTKPQSSDEYQIVVDDSAANPQQSFEQNQLDNLMGIQFATSNKSSGNGLDAYEFEKGLVEISKTEYNPSDYLYRKGTSLTYLEVRDWLQPKKTTDEVNAVKVTNPNYFDTGLNPSSEEEIVMSDGTVIQPTYLSYVLAQDYLQKEGETTSIKGISIGLALNVTQTYINASKVQETYVFSKSEIETFAKQASEKIVTALRQKEQFRNVPIMVGAYRLKSTNISTLVGGGYFMYGKANANENISTWSNIQNNEEILITDEKLKVIDSNLQQNVISMNQQLQSTFPSVTSVVSTSHISGNSAVDVTIDVNITKGSYMEVESVKQYLQASLDQAFNSGTTKIIVHISLFEKLTNVLTKVPSEQTKSVEIS